MRDSAPGDLQRPAATVLHHNRVTTPGGMVSKQPQGIPCCLQSNHCRLYDEPPVLGATWCTQVRHNERPCTMTAHLLSYLIMRFTIWCLTWRSNVIRELSGRPGGCTLGDLPVDVVRELNKCSLLLLDLLTTRPFEWQLLLGTALDFFAVLCRS